MKIHGVRIPQELLREHNQMSLRHVNSNLKFWCLYQSHHTLTVDLILVLLKIKEELDKVVLSKQDQYCLMLCLTKMIRPYPKEQRKAVLLLLCLSHSRLGEQLSWKEMSLLHLDLQAAQTQSNVWSVKSLKKKSKKITQSLKRKNSLKKKLRNKRLRKQCRKNSSWIYSNVKIISEKQQSEERQKKKLGLKEKSRLKRKLKNS